MGKKKAPVDIKVQRERAVECRKYVVENVVVKKRRLKIEAMAKKFKRTVVAVRNDVHKRTYERSGDPVGIDGEFFVYDASRLTTVGKRRYERVSEKTKIGQAAMRLVVGPSRLKDIDLRSMLTDKRADQKMSASLEDRLCAYHSKRHRTIILDSGTTTLAIARQLVGYQTPDGHIGLNSLRIITNGRKVAEELAQVGCCHDIVMLGGALRRDTEAIAGLLAVRCLESWKVRTTDDAIADIAIAGTTHVNENIDMYSDSEIESEIKSQLLCSARIRCVCASSDKLISQSGGTSAFCAFSTKTIDIVLTDDGIVKKQTNKREEDKRKNFWDLAKRKGIFVAVGAS